MESTFNKTLRCLNSYKYSEKSEEERGRCESSPCEGFKIDCTVVIENVAKSRVGCALWIKVRGIASTIAAHDIWEVHGSLISVIAIGISETITNINLAVISFLPVVIVWSVNRSSIF